MEKYIFTVIFYKDIETQKYVATLDNIELFCSGKTLEETYSLIEEMLSDFVKLSIKVSGQVNYQPQDYLDSAKKHLGNIVMFLSVKVKSMQMGMNGGQMVEAETIEGILPERTWQIYQLENGSVEDVITRAKGFDNNTITWMKNVIERERAKEAAMTEGAYQQEVQVAVAPEVKVEKAAEVAVEPVVAPEPTPEVAPKPMAQETTPEHGKVVHHPIPQPEPVLPKVTPTELVEEFVSPAAQVAKEQEVSEEDDNQSLDSETEQTSATEETDAAEETGEITENDNKDDDSDDDAPPKVDDSYRGQGRGAVGGFIGDFSKLTGEDIPDIRK